MATAQQSSVPTHLYRYCSAERAIQILAERRLFLSPPKNFNDLYEGTISRLTQYSREAACELFAKIVATRSSITLDAARATIRERDSEQMIQHTFDDICRWLEKPAELLRENSGLTCFSLRRDDQHMWGTYSVNHTGACIEFCDRSGQSEPLRRAQPVLYRDGSLSEHLPDLIAPDLSLNIHRLALWTYFVKSTDWRDEHEWRVFTLSTKPMTQEQRFLPFEAEDVRRVFCGPRMDVKLRAELAQISRDQQLKWSLFDIEPDVHQGMSNFKGVDLLDNRQDFEYWFPEVFSPKA
jgi:hypothetical protein